MEKYVFHRIINSNSSSCSIREINLKDVGLNLIVLPDKGENEITASFLFSISA